MINSSNQNRSQSTEVHGNSAKLKNSTMNITSASTNYSGQNNKNSLMTSPLKNIKKKQKFFTNVITNEQRQQTNDKDLSQLLSLSDQKKKEFIIQSRGKSIDFGGIKESSNQNITGQLSMRYTHENSSGGKYSQHGDNQDQEYVQKYYPQTSRQLSKKGELEENNKISKDQFSSTTMNYKNQKSNEVKQNTLNQTQNFPLNKMRFNLTQISKGSIPSKKINQISINKKFSMDEKNQKYQTPQKEPISQDNNQQEQPIENKDDQEQLLDWKKLKKFYMLSSQVRDPITMSRISNSDLNNLKQKQSLISTQSIPNIKDIEEYLKQQKNNDLSPQQSNRKMKQKGSLPDLSELEIQFSSSQNKKVMVQHKNTDNSDGISAKIVNFSLNNLPESRSQSRLHLRQSSHTQEDSFQNMRKQSLCEKLEPIGEKDMISGKIQLHQNSLQNQKSLQQISSLTDIPHSSHSMVSLSSQKKGSLRSNSHQRYESMQDIKNKGLNKFKKINNQSNLCNLLPMTLTRIVEKSYKSNVQILKHGLERQDPNGPKLNITEYELISIFHKIIDHYETAIRNENDIFRKMHSAHHLLHERLYALKAVDSVKDRNYKISKTIYKVFEGLNYLRFIFFETEAITEEMIVLAEVGQKEEIYPPLLSGLHSCQQLADRLYHPNFKKYFEQHDFDILLEYIIFPDLDALQTRIENYAKRLNSYLLQEMSDNVNVIMSEMFNKQAEYIYTRKNPQRIQELFQYQTPSFSSNGKNFTNTFFNKMSKYENKTNCKFQKSESQFQLNGQMDNLVQDLQKTIKKYQFLSPYSSEINPELKKRLVDIYKSSPQQN